MVWNIELLTSVGGQMKTHRLDLLPSHFWYFWTHSVRKDIQAVSHFNKSCCLASVCLSGRKKKVLGLEMSFRWRYLVLGLTTLDPPSWDKHDFATSICLDHSFCLKTTRVCISHEPACRQQPKRLLCAFSSSPDKSKAANIFSLIWSVMFRHLPFTQPIPDGSSQRSFSLGLSSTATS